jgi:hypothetical protein
MIHVMTSSRTIAVECLGGDCGTNRDPQLLEDDRRASWLALTKGRVPERMTSMSAPMPERDVSWKATNPVYMGLKLRRKPGVGKQGR